MTWHERLSTTDRLFLDLESDSDPMHVAGCFLFDDGPLLDAEGSVDIARLHAYIESRLPRLPRYRQRLAATPLEARPIWVDDEAFRLEYHVRHTHLPHPGDERQLKRLVGRIISERLDRSKPLWELWVVEGLRSEPDAPDAPVPGRFALIVKVHHCMVDGVGGVQLLESLLRPTTETAFEPAPAWFARKRPEPWMLGADEVRRRLGQPLELVRLGAEALGEGPQSVARRARDTISGLAEVLRLDLNPASDTPFNRRAGSHRRFDWWCCDFERIQAIRKKLGGTVNDVAITAISGAVERFLMDRGHSRGALAALDFRVACPVNTRSPREHDDMANHVSILRTSVPLGAADPRKRHEAVCAAFSAAKRSHQVEALDALTRFGEWTTPQLNRALMRREARRHTSNLVVTNIPGPPVPLYLLGSRMLAPYPVVPLMPEQSLGVALFSYAGVLHFGFNADWDLLPDLHDFVEAVEEAIVELEGCAPHSSRRSESARGRKRARSTSAHR